MTDIRCPNLTRLYILRSEMIANLTDFTFSWMRFILSVCLINNFKGTFHFIVLNANKHETLYVVPAAAKLHSSTTASHSLGNATSRQLEPTPDSVSCLKWNSFVAHIVAVAVFPSVWNVLEPQVRASLITTAQWETAGQTRTENGMCLM